MHQLVDAAQAEQHEHRVLVLPARGVGAKDVQQRRYRVEEHGGVYVPHVHRLRDEIAHHRLRALPLPLAHGEDIGVVQRRPADHDGEQPARAADYAPHRLRAAQHEVPAEYDEDGHAEARERVIAYPAGPRDPRGVYQNDEKGRRDARRVRVGAACRHTFTSGLSRAGISQALVGTARPRQVPWRQTYSRRTSRRS